MAGALLVASGDVTTASAPSGATITGVKPANATTTDRLIAFAFTRTGTVAHTGPTGWTQLPTAADSTVGVISVWTAVNPSSYQWTGGSGRQTLIIARAQDLASSPFGAAGAYATASNVGTADARQVMPTVDLADTYELLLAVAVNNSTGGSPTPFVTPDSMSPVGAVSTNTGGSDTTMAVYQQLVPTAGASGSRTAAHGGTNTGSGAGYLFSLRTVNKPTAGTVLSVDAGPDRTGIPAGSSVTIDCTGAGGVTPYVFVATQTSGPTASTTRNGNKFTLTAPSLSSASTLTYQIRVMDSSNPQQSAVDTINLNVLAVPGSGPALPAFPAVPTVPSRGRPRDLAQMDADATQLTAYAALVKSYVDGVVGT